MEQSQLAALLEANNRYNKDLQRYIKGTLPRHEPFNLGKPYGKLSNYLDNSENILMRQGIINKATKGHESSIKIGDLKDLPLKLYQVSNIFQSTQENSLVTVINVRDSANNPVVIPIKAKSTFEIGREKYAGNLITSIYGKTTENLEKWRAQNLELYNKERKEKTSINSISPSPILGDGVNRGLENTTKVIQKNQNPTPEQKKITDYDIRRSGNGWAVDRKEGKSWIFENKFSTKKEAAEYLKGETLPSKQLEIPYSRPQTLAEQMNELTRRNTEALRTGHGKHKHYGKGY